MKKRKQQPSNFPKLARYLVLGVMPFCTYTLDTNAQFTIHSATAVKPGSS